MIIVKIDPTTAPQKPACSGSRESPDVKKVVLKRDSILPAVLIAPSQASWSFFSFRLASGKFTSVLPLYHWSTSADAFTQIATLVPMAFGLSRT